MRRLLAVLVVAVLTALVAYAPPPRSPSPPRSPYWELRLPTDDEMERMDDVVERADAPWLDYAYGEKYDVWVLAGSTSYAPGISVWIAEFALDEKWGDLESPLIHELAHVYDHLGEAGEARAHFEEAYGENHHFNGPHEVDCGQEMFASTLMYLTTLLSPLLKPHLNYYWGTSCSGDAEGPSPLDLGVLLPLVVRDHWDPWVP